MSRNLREALNDVVGDSTWRPDNTLVIHDAEKWTTLVGYIVMATNGDNDGQVPMGCEGAVAEARASLEAEVERMRKAAKRVVAEAETDDNWEGEYTDFLVPGDAFDALRAALEEPK